MSNSATSPADTEAESVPSQWPAMRTDVPKTVTTLTGLPAVFGLLPLWFLPRIMGVRLAAAGWGAAILAHLVALALGLGFVAWAQIQSSRLTYGTPGFISIKVGMPEARETLSEYLRAPFAALVAAAHDSSPLIIGWVSRIPTIIGALEIGIPVVALLLMPFAAAGEPLGRLFARCWRLVFWSSTLIIPLGVGWLLFPAILQLLGVPAPEVPAVTFGIPPASSDESDGVAVLLFVIWAFWWLVVLVRSGLQYAGPADGPAWQPRTPRCRKCGYIILALSVAGNCPECGYPLARSVAAFQRSSRFTRWRAFVLSLRAAFSRLQRSFAGSSPR
ncbi:MAG TPA: hypothetical protein VMV94_12980 [Phycisphaerae bacterium]|nr:hypothetical protein [Phycisphaerae bacterium]